MPSLFRLQELQQRESITNEDGTPSTYFLQYLKSRGGALTTIEGELALKVPMSRLINTDGGLQGGGDLSTDRTLSLTDTGVTAGAYTAPTVTIDAKGRISAATSNTLYTDEMARDAIGAALVAGSNITITVNDGSDTITIAASGGGGSVSPSWSFGSGERRPYVTATCTGSYSGDPNAMLGFGQVSSFFFSTTAGAQELKYDFGSGGAVVISGITFVQNTNTAQGTWSFEGSNDNATWTSLATGVSWTMTAFQGAFKFTTTWTNTTAYRYYRVTKTSGSTSNIPYIWQVIFKMSPLVI